MSDDTTIFGGPRGDNEATGTDVGRTLARPSVVLFVTVSMLTVGLTLAPTALADNLGDRVTDGDSDHVPVLEALSGDFSDFSNHQVCRKTAGDSGTLDDEYYIHWASNCNSVSQDDIRLTDTDGGSAGTAVESGDSDDGKSFAGAFATDFTSNVGYIEADGEPGYTDEDWVYLSTDNTLDASNADIRLTDTDGGSPGSIVSSSSANDLQEAGDSDEDFPLSKTLQDYNAGEFHLRLYDKNGDDKFDPADEQLMLVQHSGRTFASINDVALNDPGSESYGTQLSSSSDLVPNHLIDVSSSAQFVTTDAVTSPRNDRHLFIHFDDSDNVEDNILEDAIVLLADSGSYGDRVTSESEGQGETLDGEVTLKDELFWLDVNSDNAYTPGEDPVYLNRPTALDGESNSLGLTKGDFRLTDIDDESAGSVVASDDNDLSAYGSLSANDGISGEWFVMLHDEDLTNATSLQDLSDGKTIAGDNIWDENIDGAYVSSSSEVSDGDRRIYISPHLANTKITCEDTGKNHTECETHGGEVTLNDQPLIRSTTSSPSFPGESPVYLDENDNEQVDSGDYRIYHQNLDEGEVSSGDNDAGKTLQNVTKLKSTASEYSSGDTFSSGSDDVYSDEDSTGNVSDGDIRIRMSSWPTSQPSRDSTADCTSDPMDDDCDANLQSSSEIKVTGTDSEYEASQSEYIYNSTDDLVNSADFRFLDYESVLNGGQDVASGDADTTQIGVDSDDNLYLSWCPDSDITGSTCASAGHPTKRVRAGDIKLGSSNSLIDADNSDYDIELQELDDSDNTEQALKRYNRGDSGKIIDDGLYLSFHDSSSSLAEDDIRLVEVDGSSAGSLLATGDDEELSATISRASGAFETHIEWADVDGATGYTEDDPLYVDIPTGLFSSGNDGTLSQGDVRLTTAEASGDTFQPGTFVQSGNSDLVAYSYDGGGPDWNLYWHDENRDGDVDEDEQVYVNPDTATGDVPSILSVRMNGETSGSSDGGGGGGGGGDDGGGDDGTTASPPTLSIDEPADGANVTEGEDLSIAGSASDEGSITSVVVLVDGEEIDVTGTASWSATWAAAEPGDHTIRVTATDDDGSTDTETLTVTVQEDVPVGPSVTIAEPGGGDTVHRGAQVAISGTASEGDATLSSLNLRVNGQSQNVRGLSDWSGTWTPQSTGEATIEVTATDMDGETGTATVNVTVTEPSPPSITIDAPEDGAELTAGEPTNVSGSVTPGDAGIAQVTVTVDGESLDVTGLEDFSAEYTPTGSGTFNVTAEVTDDAGLTDSDQVTVTVTGGEDTPAPGIAIVAAVLAGMAVLVGRRRG